MFLKPLPDNAKPSILFRVEHRENNSFDDGYMCARKTTYDGAPSRREFDVHLSWQRERTRFLSFFSRWRRAMQLRERLQRDGKMGIVVIAVWAENLAGVYSAEEAASRLGYLRTGPDRRRRLQNHHDEYLVEGGIAPDEYRILGIFQGDGPEREVTFESQFYTISTKIPGGLFSGSRSTNALRDIEDEIFSHSGVRDDKKRDLLVHEIGGVSNIFAFLQYKYQ